VNPRGQKLIESPYYYCPKNINYDSYHQMVRMAISPVPEDSLLGHECVPPDQTVRLFAMMHPESENGSHNNGGSNATDQLGAHYS
jgi:hypothetical protein